MAPSLARLVPKLEVEFLPEGKSVQAAMRTKTEPKVAATEQKLKPPLRRRAV